MTRTTPSARSGATGRPNADAARAALRDCPLFDGVSEEALVSVGAALRTRRYRRGEAIFHIGDPGEALYLVIAGEVKITIPSDEGLEPVILTTIGPGGFFGELALLDGAPRSASAVAMGAVESSLLHRDAFDHLFDMEPGLRRALLATLAREIRRLSSQVEDLHFLDLPGRLANHIVRSVAPDPGAPDVPAGEHRLPWPYTQGELAGMIGASRQSVNRLLSEFVADGLVRFEGDDLVIPDVARLAAAARR